MKKYVALFFVLSSMFLSCQNKDASFTSVAPATFAAEIEKAPDAQIVDVRTPEEFAQEHIKNAKNIDWNGSDFEAEMEKLDKSKPILIYCERGGRSQKAAVKLQELGFETIYELNGGFMQWSIDGFQK